MGEVWLMTNRAFSTFRSKGMNLEEILEDGIATWETAKQEIDSPISLAEYLAPIIYQYILKQIPEKKQIEGSYSTGYFAGTIDGFNACRDKMLDKLKEV